MSSPASQQFSRPRPDEREGRERPWYMDYLVSIAWAFVLLALFYALIGRMYVIPSGSMEPTLHGCEGCFGDRIFVEKVSYYFDEPEPGDVVVYEGTESWNSDYVSNRSENLAVRTVQNLGSYFGLVSPDENNLVKRVVATGGQTVSCQEGDPAVMVDGQPIDQSYTLQPTQYQIDPATGSEACGGEYFGPVTVPEDSYWMMGDNRTNSMDSRYHIGDAYQGAIPEENIRGKVQFIVLPFGRTGGIEHPDIQQQG